MYESRKRLAAIYDELLDSSDFGEDWPDGEWPVSGRYDPAEFEIVIGAVLTQNTKWGHASDSLARLAEAGLTDAVSIRRSPLAQLENLIRSSGYFRKKARVLKRIADAILRGPEDFYTIVKRDELLAIRGVGDETADAILLYAGGRPEFVADAYTRRILARYGLFPSETGYLEAKSFVELHLGCEVLLYRRFHALLVDHAKKVCRRVPLCSKCVLRFTCMEGQRRIASGM